MRIYLIRHGETDWNLEGRLQGREDIPLNKNGIQQAILCGQAFRDIKIKAVLTSPLIRAKRTAEIISEQANLGQVIVEEGLIERDFGVLAGVSYDSKKHFDTFGIEEGIEPFEELHQRLIRCIRKHAEAYYDEDIIMVSHGGAINSVISVLSGGELGSGKTRLKNACISILQYQEGNLSLVQYNLTTEEFLASIAV